MLRLVLLLSLMCVAPVFAGTPERTAAVAAAFEVPEAAVQSAKLIALDGHPLGILAHFERDGRLFAGLVHGDGHGDAFGLADTVHVRGLFDLSAAGRLPGARVLPSRLKRRGMTRPVMVVETRYKDPKPPGAVPRRGRRGERGGTSWVTMFFVELTPALPRLLRLETERHDGDGFGGFTIRGLRLVAGAEGLSLEGRRQDRLPARRARCKRPPAVPVRFVLDGMRFREVNRHPTGGCDRGTSGRLPSPALK